MKRLVIAALLCVGVVIPQTAVEAQVAPPNVVVIMLDDGRKDQIANMPEVQQQLVGKGVSFSDAIMADPLCCPSRASYMRGQYAHTTSVYNVQFEFGGWAQYLEAGIEDEMLNVWFDPTYYTAMVGKYTNGYTAIPAPGPSGSWDFWRAFNKVGYNSSGTDWSVTDGSARTFPAAYSTDYMTDRAVEAVQSSGTEPLFLWTAYYAPHSPFTPPGRYNTAAETPECDAVDLRGLPSFDESGKAEGTPAGVGDKPRWLKFKGPYTEAQKTQFGVTDPKEQCRALLAVDDGVADIITALKVKDPGLDNTVVVFTSDQGVQNGQHNYLSKQNPYEETVDVPLIVRADGIRGTNPVTKSQMVANIDLAPTLMDLAGISLPSGAPGCAQTGDIYQTRCEDLGRGGFDGYSFGPLIRNTSYTARGTLLIEHWDPGTAGKVPTFCSVRTPTQKLTRYYLDAAGSGPAGADWEGYDLSADPNELNSLVFSTSNGVPQFRGAGEALYDGLIDDLQALCDPRPPGYPGW